MSMYRQPPRHAKRRTVGQQVLRLLFALLLLGGIVSAIFLLFFRGYVVDTPDGPRLQLPFFSTAKQAPRAEKEAPEANAVFGPSEGLSLADNVDKLQGPVHAVLLSEETVLEGNIEAALQRVGGNAVLFDLRDVRGALHYVSKLPAAIESGASSATPGLNAAIRTMNRPATRYSIARVSCFSDAYLSKHAPELALQREGGAPWRDSNGLTWLSPSRDAVQSYLLDICREAADLGFDEILLTACAYPVPTARDPRFAGSDSVETLALTLEGFYGELRRVLKEEGLALSLVWEKETQAENGQRAGALLPLSDRVFFAGEAEEAEALFAAQGLSPDALSVVSILSVPGQSAASWAILEES